MIKQDLIVKVYTMLDEAEGFIFASKLCKKAIDEKEIRFDKLLSVSAVNISFACEILLKALLLSLDIKPKRKHTLFDLFLLLPKELQNSINEKIYLKYGTITSGCGLSLIETNSNVFTDWRYSFEIEKLLLNCDYSFLETFAEILKKRIGEITKWMKR